jgi:hypothetical protein
MAPLHPPVVDFSNFEQRKDEIAQDVMRAASIGELSSACQHLYICLSAAGAAPRASTHQYSRAGCRILPVLRPRHI